MEKINIIVIVFLIEFFADIIIRSLFHIKVKNLYLLFLQIPKICACVLSVYFSSNLWIVFASNLVSKIICVFFLNDTLSFKKFICILFSQYIILFSIMGFCSFLLLWFKGAYRIIFKQNFPLNYNYIALLGIFLYVFAFFCLIRNLSNGNNLSQFFVQVSLTRNLKHINVYGLIDSGNSVVDPVTNKPVILLSKKSFLKLFSKMELEKMIKEECRKVECVGVSGEKIEVPVFENIAVKLKFEKEFIEADCVVGFAGAVFENGKYDCLLNRDFL